jgi:hypothetical protein
MYKYKYKYKYGAFDERMIGTHEQDGRGFQNEVAQIGPPIVKIIHILNCSGFFIRFKVEHSSAPSRETPAYSNLFDKEINFSDVSSGYITKVIISAYHWNGWEECKVFTEFPRRARVCYKVTGTIFGGINCDQQINCNEMSCF